MERGRISGSLILKKAAVDQAPIDACAIKILIRILP
jgi:hypothetical protein